MCTWPEAVLYVHSVFGSSSILHSLWYHCREGYQCGVCITTAKSTWWSADSALLLQLREFTPVGGNCKVYLPDKGTRSIWTAKGDWVFYCKFLRGLMLKCKPCCQIQIVNSVTVQMHVVVCKHTTATSKVKEHEPYSWPHGLRRKQKCAARPGRRPRCGGWRKVCGTGH